MAQSITVRSTAANGTTAAGAQLTWSQLDTNFNSIGPSASIMFKSLGIGADSTGVTGQIVAANTITAYYSDERLKNFQGTIQNAVEKVLQLNGYYFTENEKAKELGYDNDRLQVGVSAQEVEKVLPEVVTESAISSEYKTVWYEKLTPLLIEAVKEQQIQIENLKLIVKTQQEQINSLLK